MSWREALNAHYEAGIKPVCNHELGVEIEHFIVEKDTYAAVPYAGKGGVREIICRLAEKYPGYEALGKDDFLGFEVPDFAISLEPAAQLEISIAKNASIEQLEKIYEEFRRNLDEILEDYGYEALTVGTQPVSRVEDLPLIPKERYRLMNRHFEQTGTGGKQMMRGTSSVQVSVDYYSEEDFRRKMQAAHLFMPILKLLTDNAKDFEGKKIEGYLKRTDIWKRTDPSRCGILPGVFSPEYSFNDYSSFLGEMPLIFTEGEEGDTYTGFKKVSEIYADREPGEAEVRHILSMAFPEVRLKHYIEIRFADSMPAKYTWAYVALIKGLLYSKDALDYAESRIKEEGLSKADLEAAIDSLMTSGWRGRVYGAPVRTMARALLRLAAKALTDREREYLEAFYPVIDMGGIPNYLRSIKDDEDEKPLTSALLRDEYRSLIEENTEANREGAVKLMANMERSPLYFRDRFTSKTLQIPRVYTDRDDRRFKEIVKVTYGIFDKVIREYITAPDYRKLFPFSKELEELILLDRGYDVTLPIARFDIFYHEDTGDFYFCEINTDGTSAMNEDRIHDELIIDNPAHQAMRRRYNFRSYELFDSWVKAFMDIYGTYDKKVDKPSVAIVDFLDMGTVREFQEFARHFQKAGIDCEVCDIRDLTFRDGKLYSKAGNVIDAIYRRAVTTDIMDHIGELEPFIRAVRENACFVAGSFATQIIHHKWLFYVLGLDRTRSFLTEEEIDFIDRHIPKTLPFKEGKIALEEVLSHKDRYILKPDDSYASNGVFAGVEFTEAEWSKKAIAVYGSGYICQEYAPQYSTENIDFAFGDGEWYSYINMAGLYVYNGNFAGVFARAAEGSGIIASHRNERTQPTYVVSKK
ncbi:MAG: hypothetical protein E7241_09370 [Lachnospiraceae bacterium]|nr:hypothetical protein [Lachnospiraceae bacterium]